MGKVLTTQIPTTLPKKTGRIISITTTTKPLVKEIVIGGSNGSSCSLKPKSTETDKVKGKGVSVELTKEERKVAIEAEIEKQRHVQSILRLVKMIL